MNLSSVEPGDAAAQGMRFLIVDDHPLVREGTRLALREIDAAAEVLEADTLEEAFACLAQPPRVHLTLLDLDLHATTGGETLRRLKAWTEAHNVDTRVVVLSGLAKPELVREVLDLFGTGFILKASSKAVFRQAIALTLAGGVYIPELLLKNWGPGGAKLNPSAAWPASRPVELTLRETEVAALLVRGYTYKRIAQELERWDGKSISDHTVRVHVSSIAWKLGVTENAKAGVMAEIARRGLTFRLARRGSSKPEAG
jgi:DNA-binding NarL/FixJ family response regulator